MIHTCSLPLDSRKPNIDSTMLKYIADAIRFLREVKLVVDDEVIRAYMTCVPEYYLSECWHEGSSPELVVPSELIGMAKRFLENKTANFVHNIGDWLGNYNIAPKDAVTLPKKVLSALRRFSTKNLDADRQGTITSLRAEIIPEYTSNFLGYREVCHISELRWDPTSIIEGTDSYCEREVLTVNDRDRLESLIYSMCDMAFYTSRFLADENNMPSDDRWNVRDRVVGTKLQSIGMACDLFEVVLYLICLTRSYSGVSVMNLPKISQAARMINREDMDSRDAATDKQRWCTQPIADLMSTLRADTVMCLLGEIITDRQYDWWLNSIRRNNVRVGSTVIFNFVNSEYDAQKKKLCNSKILKKMAEERRRERERCEEDSCCG